MLCRSPDQFIFSSGHGRSVATRQRKTAQLSCGCEPAGCSPRHSEALGGYGWNLGSTSWGCTVAPGGKVASLISRAGASSTQLMNPLGVEGDRSWGIAQDEILEFAHLLQIRVHVETWVWVNIKSPPKLGK